MATPKNSLHLKSIISVSELSMPDINLIMDVATHFKQGHATPLLQNKIIASCFFEPSTRTRLSFESATHRLGGQVIGFSEAKNTSSGQKGESLSDAIKAISSYADAIVLRHPQSGSARLAAEVANVPVINAGDGNNQHPTQALLDLFSIRETQDKLEGLNIAFVGDLKYGRTIHSLAKLCALYNMRCYFVAPSTLGLSNDLCENLKAAGIEFSFHQNIEEVIGNVDILYMTRFQRERFSEDEQHALTNNLILTPELVAKAKLNLKILHPLPRQEEIPVSIDTLPQAYYFQQAENGVYVRQALLALLLSKKINLKEGSRESTPID